MTRRAAAPPPLRPAALSLDAKRAAILKLQCRVDELEAFNPATVARMSAPNVTALSQAIDRTLTDIFGADSVEYGRYKNSAHLANGWYEGSTLQQYQQYLAEDKETSLAILRGIISGFREDIDENGDNAESVDATQTAHISKIFIVHGHDYGARDAVARFLEKIELQAIILQEQPDQGLSIIEKFESYANQVGFAVVLLTPDDLGGSSSAQSPSSRTRQNVVFELGYFAGKLGRGRVCLLRKGVIEIPSDLHGVIYTELDANDGWKLVLARELKTAGLKFDAAKVYE